MEFVKAFLVGGVICALVQILMDNTKLMPGRIMVLQGRVEEHGRGWTSGNL